MQKLITISVILSLAILSGCGGTDEPTTPTGPGGPTVVRVVANTTAGAPTLSSVNEAMWSTVTEYAIDVSSQNSPKVTAPASSAASDSVYVKAIVSGGELFLRLKYDNDSLNLLKDYNFVTDSSNLNFSSNNVSHEDQLYVMFAGLPNGAIDVWNWRSLETAPAGLAEGKTLFNVNDTPFTDAGAQVVALPNAPIGSRPPWVHVTGSAFTGEILYLEDRDSTSKHITDVWRTGQVVPGYYIDTLVGARVKTPAFAQSRWDIFTVDSYDALNNKITVVLKRKLNTTYAEDLVLVDSVQVRIGIYDDQSDFLLGGSRRGFTELFWLIL